MTSKQACRKTGRQESSKEGRTRGREGGREKGKKVERKGGRKEITMNVMLQKLSLYSKISVIIRMRSTI